jgi:hypothetical protein
LLAFRGDGTKIAITGSGKTTILDLKTRSRSQCDMNRLNSKLGMDLMPDLCWMGRFLYRNEQLYDFDSPVPVWGFSGIGWAMPEGDRLWAIVRPRRSKEFVLRSYQLPLGDIEARLREIYRTSDVLPLRSGDAVRIDVSGIPAHRQAEVRANLTERLLERDYRPATSASVVLRASIDDPTPATVTYVPRKGPLVPLFVTELPEEARTFDYHRRPARMQIIKGNKVLWSSNKNISPPTRLKEWPEYEYLGRYGGPDYELFSKRELPEYVRDSRGIELGQTYLFAEGWKSR